MPDDNYTCSWEEEAAIFMERDSHDPVSEVKCFLDTISVVNIYVNIEDSWMVPSSGKKREALLKQ